MKPATGRRRDTGEQGAALFLVLLLLLVGGGLVFVSRIKSAQVELEAQRKTSAALAVAKQALLGYAVLDPGSAKLNPGRLPCPDQDNDGNAQGAACATPYVGWFPWRTLDTGDLRDGTGQRLWLLVDGAFRSGGGPLNTNTQPSLTLDGQPVVAVLFAPGPVLDRLGQVRPGSGPFSAPSAYPNYLEGVTRSPPAVHTAPSSDTYNDSVLALTPQTLFTLVTQRMARELAAVNPPPYSATTVADLNKPSLWIANQWDDALDPSSTVSPTAITLKFRNCAIVYTITGKDAVTRDRPSC
ncbi:hypothetical protein [Thiobacter aerophilum]|uniref:Type II secretion system protein n=1 Tax=Thiobacter aerophilum TaxID=3121275 RepID=A0ABV0EDM1_9BURK